MLIYTRQVIKIQGKIQTLGIEVLDNGIIEKAFVDKKDQ